MIYTVYDNRLVNSVRRITYKKKGSNFLYINIENFMIKLSYLKNCDIFQKSGLLKGGGDGDEETAEQKKNREKKERIEYEGLKKMYIIPDNMSLFDLKYILEEFIKYDLLPIFEKCRTLGNKEDISSSSITEYLMNKYNFLSLRGNNGDYEIRKFFNMKILLSCLLYSYLNYNMDDITYINNLEYINLLLTQLEENATTGIYVYDNESNKNPYGFNQLNIFAFIIFIINRFNIKHKIKLIQYFIKEAYNTDNYTDDVNDDIELFEGKTAYITGLYDLFNKKTLLNKINFIKICNSLIIHMNTHILEKYESSISRTQKSDKSHTSSPIHKKRKPAQVPTSSQSNSKNKSNLKNKNKSRI